MKTEIRKIRYDLYRACYDLGAGETTVPFHNKIEAEAFLKGFRHAVDEMESIAERNARMEKLKSK